MSLYFFAKWLGNSSDIVELQVSKNSVVTCHRWNVTVVKNVWSFFLCLSPSPLRINQRVGKTIECLDSLISLEIFLKFNVCWLHSALNPNSMFHHNFSAFFLLLIALRLCNRILSKKKKRLRYWNRIKRQDICTAYKFSNLAKRIVCSRLYPLSILDGWVMKIGGKDLKLIIIRFLADS